MLEYVGSKDGRDGRRKRKRYGGGRWEKEEKKGSTVPDFGGWAPVRRELRWASWGDGAWLRAGGRREEESVAGSSKGQGRMGRGPGEAGIQGDKRRDAEAGRRGRETRETGERDN